MRRRVPGDRGSTVGIDNTDTSTEVLAAYKHIPLVADLCAFRRVDGFLCSIAGPLDKALKASPDGRVRASIDQLGCRTGRVTTSEPNLFGLPRDKSIRSCVIPDPGYVFVDADFPAADMRMAAELTGDQALRDALNGPIDPQQGARDRGAARAAALAEPP